jgi:cytochrome P450
MVTPRADADFDHRAPAWLAERHANTAGLRQHCPVLWNRQYGGYWFVSGHTEVAAVARDAETFSHLFAPEGPDGLSYIGTAGIPRPEGLPSIGIGEAVGERHAALRRVINPFMLPPAVAQDRPVMEQAARWFLDQKIADGQMDTVSDFTSPVPGLWTMKLMGLPAQMWGHFAEYFHAVAAYSADMPEYQRAVVRTPEMIAELLEISEQRKRKPGDDLLSRLVTLEVEGAALNDDDLIGVLWNLIGGGLDTTTSLTSLALVHLAQHPDLRQRLVADPSLLTGACEEYLRWTTVAETLSRTCTTDTELGGQLVKRGDFVMVSWLGANFDPAVFDRPDEVDIDRAPNPHLAFGVGAHRCIGLHVARMLFDVMMREMLGRIPEYSVDLENTQFYQGNPLYGVVKMPTTFTPGSPLGVNRPF